MAYLNGRNQESVSEAFNAWYGVSLWGRAVGDDQVPPKFRYQTSKNINKCSTAPGHRAAFDGGRTSWRTNLLANS